ncbi:MAG: peptidoglycan DD-metalloendopeptidase family protein [Thermodesulfobacteriota bacterium]|nr:peptidoglycan DD-metalloendopeptidase family protein [Thermodesulfobacteriota bacterium]
MFFKKKKELTSIKKRIRQSRKDISEINKKELAATSEVSQIEKRLSNVNKNIELLNSNIESMKQRVDDTGCNISQIERNITTLSPRLRDNLIQIYRLGEIRYTDRVFSSGSYTDKLRCYRFLSFLLDYNMALIEGYRKDLLKMKSQRDDCKEDEVKFTNLIVGEHRKKSDIQVRLQRKTKLLRSVKRKKMAYISKVNKLEKDSKGLQSMIDKLKKEIGKDLSIYSDKGFEAFRGKLDIPVTGKVLPLFGRQKDQRYNTYTFHKGIDILAPVGSKIKTIYDGKVLFSDWFKGYGKIIIVDHGGSYCTLFAHASRLIKKAGDEVKKGEVIALVGDTDSSKGPHLYFEIRYQGKPQNPIEWLAIPN